MVSVSEKRVYAEKGNGLWEAPQGVFVNSAGPEWRICDTEVLAA